MNDHLKHELAADLSIIAAEAETYFRKLASRMLDSDLLAAGFGPHVIDAAQAARVRGRQICLEITADELGAPVISLLAADGAMRDLIATMRRPVAN